jgi:hypothetical protein
MDFVSIRIITGDVARLAAFYEQVTGATATWGNDDFAELPTASGTLALASSREPRQPVHAGHRAGAAEVRPLRAIGRRCVAGMRGRRSIDVECGRGFRVPATEGARPCRR